MFSSISRNILRITPQGIYGLRPAARTLHANAYLLNKNSSLFGSLETDNSNSLDKGNENSASKITERLQMAMERDEEDDASPEVMKEHRDAVTFENDDRLQKYIKEERKLEKPATEILLSPLKRQLYEEACKINGGFYKPNTVVKLPNSKESYKLHLTSNEIDVLEPSIYLKSYRIKSSMKKATIFLRLLREMDLKTAITQCQFADKAIGQEVAEVLKRGLEDAKILGLEANDLYLAQIWTGSDGNWWKRIDIKGRGRHGIFTHRFVHVRCILKTKSVTKRRLEYEASVKQQRRKPWVQLADKPVRGVTGGVYKW